MNLIIGNTSQLSHYFPSDYHQISSRNIDWNYINSNQWDSVYITFADSRRFIETSSEFQRINVNYTLEIIEKLQPISRRIVWYSSADLWNNHDGWYHIGTPFNFKPNQCMQSKCDLSLCLRDKQKFYNVITLFPVNFNSVHRRPGFLFHDIFQSILTKKPISVGNLDFLREMVHPKYIVERSLMATSDEIIGSGRLTHIGNFVKSLCVDCGLAEDHIKSRNEPIFHNTIYMSLPITNYDKLYQDTLNELLTKK